MTPLELATHLQGLTPEERTTFLDEVNTELDLLHVPFQLAGKPEIRTGDPGDK